MRKINKKLHLQAVTGLVPTIELLDLQPPVRRFVGWKMTKKNIDGKDRFEFVKKQEGDIVKYHSDYVKAVKQGALKPLDKETAELCGVEFHSPTRKRNKKTL